MSTILLTGSSGFIGQALARRLLAEGHNLKLPVRAPLSWQSDNAQIIRIEGLDASTNWTQALSGVETVVHCAGVCNPASPQDCRRCNVEGSVRLASQSARAEVRRFVFISTVEVCGGRTLPGRPFSVESIPAPANACAASKLEAEHALFALTASSRMEVVIVRPPPVYGPGVKGDFLSLMKWIHRGKPLPLPDIDCRRSMVSRSNLVDLLALCVHHPAVAGHILHAGDGEDLLVSDFLLRLGKALEKPVRLSHMPAWLSGFCGRRALFERLRTPMQVDIEHTRRLLGWSPPYAVDDSLAQMVAYFRKHASG